jgi:hypothetical protein
MFAGCVAAPRGCWRCGARVWTALNEKEQRVGRNEASSARASPQGRHLHTAGDMSCRGAECKQHSQPFTKAPKLHQWHPGSPDRHLGSQSLIAGHQSACSRWQFCAAQLTAAAAGESFGRCFTARGRFLAS